MVFNVYDLLDVQIKRRPHQTIEWPFTSFDSYQNDVRNGIPIRILPFIIHGQDLPEIGVEFVELQKMSDKIILQFFFTEKIIMLINRFLTSYKLLQFCFERQYNLITDVIRHQGPHQQRQEGGELAVCVVRHQ